MSKRITDNTSQITNIKIAPMQKALKVAILRCKIKKKIISWEEALPPSQFPPLVGRVTPSRTPPPRRRLDSFAYGARTRRLALIASRLSFFRVISGEDDHAAEMFNRSTLTWIVVITTLNAARILLQRSLSHQ